MRRVAALAFMMFSLMSGDAMASVQCLAPLERLINTTDFFQANMVIHPDKDSSSITLTYRDDPRTVVNFSLSEPIPSTGLSRSEYLEKYQKSITKYAATVQRYNREIETYYFPTEPVSWGVVEETSMETVGPVYQGVISIRFGENCLLSANFISPNNPNLVSRLHDLTTAITGLRDTSKIFLLTTSFEPEDTAPRGIVGLAIGLVAPLVAAFLLYIALSHFTRLDAPSRSTRAVVVSDIALSLLVLFQQKKVFISGLAIMKYTDAFLLLVICASICAVSLALKQRGTVLALVTGATTGGSMLASGTLGWSADPLGYIIVGGAMIMISVLGFVAWNFDFKNRRFAD